MKYASPRLRSMLAAEYVLGTLHGRARARFVRLLSADAGLRAEVTRWEQRLAHLAGGIAPVAPRAIVWTAIDQAINSHRVTALPTSTPRSLPWWRGAALVASAAAILLAVALRQQMDVSVQVVLAPRIVPVPVTEALPYVATLSAPKSDARWQVSMYPEKAMIKVAALGSYPTPLGRELELWLLAKDGPKPLGMLPASGQKEMPVPKSMAVPAQGEVMLAVSVEPVGGSPTGLPTGPVILTAPALRVL